MEEKDAVDAMSPGARQQTGQRMSGSANNALIAVLAGNFLEEWHDERRGQERAAQADRNQEDDIEVARHAARRLWTLLNRVGTGKARRDYAEEIGQLQSDLKSLGFKPVRRGKKNIVKLPNGREVDIGSEPLDVKPI